MKQEHRSIQKKVGSDSHKIEHITTHTLWLNPWRHRDRLNSHIHDDNTDVLHFYIIQNNIPYKSLYSIFLLLYNCYANDVFATPQNAYKLAPTQHHSSHQSSPLNHIHIHIQEKFTFFISIQRVRKYGSESPKCYLPSDRHVETQRRHERHSHGGDQRRLWKLGILWGTYVEHY